mmetsp:Transcript_33511/g.61674  ORF Transcript_33511/g.61674 Transcript_33511/m.61674 type:complete len:124 (+) Transcript_33511:143-514(+)
MPVTAMILTVQKMPFINHSSSKGINTHHSLILLHHHHWKGNYIHHSLILYSSVSKERDLIPNNFPQISPSQISMYQQFVVQRCNSFKYSETSLGGFKRKTKTRTHVVDEGTGLLGRLWVSCLP